MPIKKYILPIIVFAQFCCTSLWFAGNAIIFDLIGNFNLSLSSLSHLTSAVQFGFIIGTFLFAILAISDRFSASKVFFISAMIASGINLLTVLEVNTFKSLFAIRFGTGFFLAGIYPVGMKIASDFFKSGLGKSLGFLVGALVIGTAFPHALKVFGDFISWKSLVYITSIVAFLGGLVLVLFVPEGPYKVKSQKFDITLFYSVFKIKKFRSAAFGYFGHMWELYAFWAFVPFILSRYLGHHNNAHFNVSLWSFIIIGIGAVGCVFSGFLSQIYTPKKVAVATLSLSCICCLVSPIFFLISSETVFLGFLLFWGIVVIADSPLFSTLVAQSAPNYAKGTALTIVNSIGFGITILSIQLINSMQNSIEVRHLFLVLAIGPFFGVLQFALNKFRV
ncbi:MFS transporter [uncultured Algibacter sp.]|uniref:MFS transporter n=1 Tax=uncultured Algibacter sp. TaxID=298659 RepID=UPI00262547FF|nr:MFS transporter [uncultured Algibacter sp.]